MDGVAKVVSDLAALFWREFLYILPYLAIGVVMEAVIRTFKWHVKIRKALTRYGSMSIVFAAFLGAFNPLCACAVLPLVISLMVAGLPLAPAMALLVTSPLMSPATYAMLSAMLGFGWANLVLFCALVLGVGVGVIVHLLRRRGFSAEDVFREKLPQGDFHDPNYPVEKLRCECGKQLSHRVDRCTHHKGLVFLARLWEGTFKIGKFVMIGLLINVIVTSLVPNHWIVSLLSGEGIWPIFAITFATIPLHLPQVTAASMIFGFYLPDPGEIVPLATGPGIAMLIGGPVTALPVMGVFLAMFHKRVVLLYLGLCVTGTLLLATTLRLIF
ncbi:permease [Geoalkalibacter halelectricus]|uniref:Permease n=1 Tax=Geoalkalibacter halelectricus TaxID=2847045 RepID=A0ABY5ZQ26_9BACT|nr:permease [Geoalkalibacter halelectricus]MDO3377031.1 permease [Geoalkalibacter halelectricus]UWZ81252.1 permease [Geoalkalibacter halelectricus]